MLLALALILIFASVILLSAQFMPSLLEKISQEQAKKANQTEKQLDRMFIEVKKERLVFFYVAAPLIAGAVVFAFFSSIPLAFIAALFVSLLPKLVIKWLAVRRKARFEAQLVDALMVLASSLKGGLSLIQSFEALTEDLSAPMSQEIGLVVRENKMGLTLEESLEHLQQRMNVEELRLVINAILVAKETGGDLTKVLSRLSVTIRDSRKLKENIRTLTLQGRMQGIIMSFLPFVFIIWVVTFNKQHFDIMLKSELGRILLFVAAGLQITGMFLIKKFSDVKL